MDRDTVRLLLIVAGLLLLAIIYLWGRFKPSLPGWQLRKPSMDLPIDDQPRMDEGVLDDEGFIDGVRVIPTGARKEPVLSGLDFGPAREDDDFELGTLPLLGEEPEIPSEPEPVTPHPVDEEGGAPFLIQVSVVAGPGRTFSGPELKQALLDADLLYGDMGIFHRYDHDLTRSLFSVASLVEPGTFPIDDMEHFDCPGIVLFFQTARVSNPLGIYDDLVNTSRELAHCLHGIQWDENRQPLSATKIAHMRNLLKQPTQKNA